VNLNPPSELHLDALREVANIGVGRAASALSQLVGGRKVLIEVPQVMVLPVSEVTELIGGMDAPVIAASLGMTGELEGSLLLVMPEPDAHRLCGLLLNLQSSGALEDPQRSAFSEVANILASACLTAIGTLTQFRVLPSIPTLAQDTAQAVVQNALAQDSQGKGVVLEARFSITPAPPITGQFLVLPKAQSLDKLLARLGVS
jgi:chemotaxis protein CheC